MAEIWEGLPVRASKTGQAFNLFMRLEALGWFHHFKYQSPILADSGKPVRRIHKYREIIMGLYHQLLCAASANPEVD